jgi:hypothetical protein
MATRNPAVQGVVFFAIFFVAVVALEATLLVAMETVFNTRLLPRGLGWIVMPFTAGLAGWAFGQQVGFEGLFRATSAKTGDLLQVAQFRAWVAGSVLWAIFLAGVFLIFDPFDRYQISYWRQEDWLRFIAMLAGPPFIAFLGIFLFRWALNTDSKTAPLDVAQMQQKHPLSEAVLRNLFWTLPALAVVNGTPSTKKLQLIEDLHLQLTGTSLGNDIIKNMADSFLRNGPERAKDILSKHRSEMQAKDREMLVKFCCLLLSLDKPVSKKEGEFICEIAEALEISPARLRQL